MGEGEGERDSRSSDERVNGTPDGVDVFTRSLLTCDATPFNSVTVVTAAFARDVVATPPSPLLSTAAERECGEPEADGEYSYS